LSEQDFWIKGSKSGGFESLNHRDVFKHHMNFERQNVFPLIEVLEITYPNYPHPPAPSSEGEGE